MGCSPPGSSVCGILQAGTLERAAIGDLPDPGIEPAAPALAGGFPTPEPPGSPMDVRLLITVPWVPEQLQTLLALFPSAFSLVVQKGQFLVSVSRFTESSHLSPPCCLGTHLLGFLFPVIQVSAPWPAPLPRLPPEEPVLRFLVCFSGLEQKEGRAGFEAEVTIPATSSSLGRPGSDLTGSGRCRMCKKRRGKKEPPLWTVDQGLLLGGHSRAELPGAGKQGSEGGSAKQRESAG